MIYIITINQIGAGDQIVASRQYEAEEINIKEGFMFLRKFGEVRKIKLPQVINDNFVGIDIYQY